MKRSMLWAAAGVLLPWVLMGLELRNGALEADGGAIPGWTNTTKGISAIRPVAGGGVEVTVTAEHQFHTGFEQVVRELPKNSWFKLSGVIVAERPDSAYLAIKLYQGKNDLFRADSRRNKAGETTVELVFNTREADKLAVICRVVADQAEVGKKTVFRKLTLVPCDPPPPPKKTVAAPAVKTPAFRVGTVDASAFRNYSANTSVKAEGDAVTVTIREPARYDSTLVYSFEQLPPHQRFYFAAEASAKNNGNGYLSVKFYRNGKEQARLESRNALRRESTLWLDFDTADYERIDLLLRVPQERDMVGEWVTFRNPRIGEGAFVPPGEAERGRFRLTPGYQNCSLELTQCRAKDSTGFQGVVRYRAKGEPGWRKAQAPVYVPDERAARMSFFKLEENTDYEVEAEIDDAGVSETWRGEFRTRNSEVPVARTVVLNAGNFSGKLVINESGSPEGYIRYTAEPGFVLEGAPDAREVVLVEDASYILLDDLVVRGGRRFGIALVASENIVVRNCDIAQFGELGTPELKLGNKYVLNGDLLTDLAGIRILDSGNLLIERNYIHDSRGKTCPWFYSHPDGAFGMQVRSTGGVTLRYNDIVGSDEYRWNDAVGGYNNGSPYGRFYRDSEIYGNYFAFGSEDGLELDGGHQNSRFYWNKVEGMLCGVSTAPCMLGPSYLFENLFCNPGDEFQAGNLGLKNTFQLYGKGQLLFFNNTIHGNWIGYSSYYSVPVKLAFPQERKALTRNNIFAVDGEFFSDAAFQLPYDFNYDLLWNLRGEAAAARSREWLAAAGAEKNAITGDPRFLDVAGGDFRLAGDSPGHGTGVAVDGLLEAPVNQGAFQPGGPEQLPFRPVGFLPEKSQLNFTWNEAEQQSLAVTVDAGVTGSFRIRQNATSDFFTVTPASGEFQPGEPVILTVTLHPERMASAKVYSGAFLLTDDAGFSRPVSVRADFRGDAARVAQERRGVIYGTVSPQDDAGNCLLEFEVKEPGGYYLFGFASQVPYAVHLRRAGSDEEFRRYGFYGIHRPDRPTWQAMSPVLFSAPPPLPMMLEAGTHRFEVQRRRDFHYQLDAVALAKTPEELLNSPFIR